MDAHEIKDLLHSDPLSVCELLLPNGKLERNDWCVGSTAGEEGRSLKIATKGRKVGTWKDFAGDEGGNNLLELWAKVKRVTFVDAYIEAKKYLGVFEEEYLKGGVKNMILFFNYYNQDVLSVVAAVLAELSPALSPQAKSAAVKLS